MVGDLKRKNPGFIFLRHGETQANELRVACGGDCELSLNPSGQEQMRQAAALLRESKYAPQLIITSNLDRTVQSAQIIQSELNPDAEILFDSDIKERSLGNWNGQSSSIINPQLAAGLTPTNGESRAEFRTRTLLSFNRYLARYVHWPLIIGSRGTARILLECVNDSDPTNFSNGRLLRVDLVRSSEFKISKIERL